MVTEPDLTVVAEGPVLVLHQPDSLLDAMDGWNKSTHGKSGLIDKVRASTINEAPSRGYPAGVPAQHVPAGKSPLCGNTISQRPPLHVRHAAVREVLPLPQPRRQHAEELARRWAPAVYKGFEKSRHEALADIYDRSTS